MATAGPQGGHSNPPSTPGRDSPHPVHPTLPGGAMLPATGEDMGALSFPRDGDLMGAAAFTPFFTPKTR